MVSTDPGVDKVVKGVAYMIDDVPFVGTFEQVVNVVQGVVMAPDPGMPEASDNQIEFTKGDTTKFRFQLKKPDGTFLNLTGATFQTKVLDIDDQEILIDIDQHSVDLVDNTVMILDPTSDQRAALKEDVLTVTTQVTQGADVTTFRAIGAIVVRSFIAE